jgi:hypothetical protein
MSTLAPILEQADAEPDELVRRLRSLEWPAPDASLRDRCLETILDGRAFSPTDLGAPADSQAAIHDGAPADAQAVSHEDAPVELPPRRRFAAERGERYEATRWSAPRCVGLAAPARQPRFAAVL